MARHIPSEEIESAINALIDGPGYFLFESIFDHEEIAQANKIINQHSDNK